MIIFDQNIVLDAFTGRFFGREPFEADVNVFSFDSGVRLVRALLIGRGQFVVQLDQQRPLSDLALLVELFLTLKYPLIEYFLSSITAHNLSTYIQKCKIKSHAK